MVLPVYIEPPADAIAASTTDNNDTEEILTYIRLLRLEEPNAYGDTYPKAYILF
jgi:hypothetical protein